MGYRFFSTILGNNLLTLLVVVLTCTYNSYGQYKKERVPFSYQPQQVDISLEGFYDLTDALPDNYVKDGSQDYTKYIQKALDTHTRVRFPDFIIGVQGVYPKSNSILYFQANSTLKLMPTDRPRYQVLGLHGVENVKIYNANIEGDLDNHLGTKGEWGFGIDIRSSRNIELYNTQVSATWGDGLIVASGPKGIRDDVENLYATSNIFIKNIGVDYARRNGISIINGDGIKIENATIANVYKTAPKAGIDIEPDNKKGVLDNVDLKGITVYNSGIGLDLHLVHFTSEKEHKRFNLIVEGFDMISTSTGIYLAGYRNYHNLKEIKGAATFKNITTKNVLKPFVKRPQYSLYPQINVNGFKVLNSEGKTQNSNRLLKFIADTTKLKITN